MPTSFSVSWLSTSTGLTVSSNSGYLAEVPLVNVFVEVAMMDEVFDLPVQLVAIIHVMAVIPMKVIVVVFVARSRRH